MKPSVSVVIPAHDAERTLRRVLESLAAQSPPPDDVIVVDDSSTDATAAIAADLGARVVPARPGGFAGGARNAGWDAATSDVVVFLDADAIPGESWGTGLARALEEHPGAIVGCARTFAPSTRWGWVAHLESETPYLPRGGVRKVAFLSSYCMAVPREAPLRWDESYGGEDCVFCADALDAGLELVFDPRYHALHDHDRESFAGLRRQQKRIAYGIARCGAIQQEGLHKRIFSRVPVHHFALLRLPKIYSRVRETPELRAQFLRNLPRLIVAEWTLGASACRYALRRPPLRGGGGAEFRAQRGTA
jgi:glycosyltransferase involved in cell wall biosynthesis